MKRASGLLEKYVAESMSLIFNEDNYYLMCFSSKYYGINNYGVDRMEDVSVEALPVSEGAKMDDFDIAKYTEQAFKMYGGLVSDVTLEFENKLNGVVKDKFGEQVNIVRTDTDQCVASVQLQVGSTFWGWLFQFGKQMRILSPEQLVGEY